MKKERLEKLISEGTPGPVHDGPRSWDTFYDKKGIERYKDDGREVYWRGG